LATNITALGTQITVNGKGAEISDVRLSGVAPGTYTMTFENTGEIGTLGLPAARDAKVVVNTSNALPTASTVEVALSLGSGAGATAGTAVLSYDATGKITGIAIKSGSEGSGYRAGDVLTITGVTATAASTQSVDISSLSGIVVNTLGTETVDTNLLKMTGTINGQTTTQSVTVQAGVANAKQTLNFDSFGIQFDVSSYQAQDAKDIGYTLAALNTGSNPSTYGTSGQLIPGQVVVARGNNSNLKFQSGPTTDAFIEINTLNIQTASTGAYAGTSSEMMNLGTRVTAASAGNLGALGMNNTIDQWQTAFKNMADATDQALEYISTQRATYGSQINRISFTSTNLTAQSTNLQNSRSAIIDTDFAAETAKLTKGQIMQQAATAMLAQANQMPNVILSLLK
jgi:flagellin